MDLQQLAKATSDAAKEREQTDARANAIAAILKDMPAEDKAALYAALRPADDAPPEDKATDAPPADNTSSKQDPPADASKQDPPVNQDPPKDDPPKGTSKPPASGGGGTSSPTLDNMLKGDPASIEAALKVA